MKKRHLPPSIYIILYLLILLISCGTATTTVSTENKSRTLEKSQLDKQIGEYITSIFEDSRGNLWIGTLSKGLARYDGKRLRYFTTDDGLAGNFISGIIEDNKNELWIGTKSGLSKYDGKKFTNYYVEDGLCSELISNLLLDSKNNLWIGTWDGICLYDGHSFVDFPLTNPAIEIPSYQETTGWITAIMEDMDKNIWIGRSGYGLAKYDGKAIKHYTKSDGLASSCVQEIEQDNGGTIWIGTRIAEQDHPDESMRSGEAGLNSFDGKEFKHYPELKGLSKNNIYGIYKDSEGIMWIAATGVGLYRYDGENFDFFNNVENPDLLPYGIAIQSMLKDRKGTIWLGMSGGLFKLENSKIVYITQDGPWE